MASLLLDLYLFPYKIEKGKVSSLRRIVSVSKSKKNFILVKPISFSFLGIWERELHSYIFILVTKTRIKNFLTIHFLLYILTLHTYITYIHRQRQRTTTKNNDNKHYPLNSISFIANKEVLTLFFLPDICLIFFFLPSFLGF